MTRPRIAVAWPKDDYLTALEHAGADAWVLDPARDDVASVLDASDGILLTGGADVEPARYGQTPHSTVKSDPARDAYEFELARGALDRRVPLLAICRGIQLLNVAAGGTLIQDIASERPTDVPHTIKIPPDVKAHDVRLTPGSALARLLAPEYGDRPFAVNSRHHQAVKDVAPGFVVAATAPDGIVEAIERPGATLCLAVQWHPENYWRTGEFSALFRALVDAARRRVHRDARES